MSRIRSRLAAVAVSTAGALALAAPLAHAGPIGDGADCSVQSPLTQPFFPWADPASYALAPDGGLEGGAAGWTLFGGAATTAGNERFLVGGASDSRALSLPSGSSATSAPRCVGLQWPTIRVFARSSGTSSSPRTFPSSRSGASPTLVTRSEWQVGW